MKIKAKPRRPVRSTKRLSTNLYDGMSGQELLALMESYGCPPEKITLRIDSYVDSYDYGSGDNGIAVVEVNLEADRGESEEEYAKRLTDYEKDMAKYNKWYEKNRGEIEKELSDRKEKKLTAKQQAILAQEEHIKKQELRLEKSKAYLEKKKKDAGL